ncbi:putative sodium bile acid cotransporter, sodium/solute symporter superfamily [Helianthus annuus]|nr:putative sodium bile acid cotransporter, sodium/solute symporter superfamily [Helianthus annuus]
MPTAISSGVALTTLAGGNPALALAMTVISSLLGILIVPFSISRLIAGGVGASVPADEMFRSLIGTVLIPLILGKVTRYLSCLTCSDHLSCHKPHKFNSYFFFQQVFRESIKGDFPTLHTFQVHKLFDV